MSTRSEVGNSSPRMDQQPADLTSLTNEERSSQKLELTKATRNTPVGDDTPMHALQTPEIYSVHARCATRNPPSDASAFKGARAVHREKRNEKEPDERIKWKNTCLKEETHVEAEKRFGEVEKARLEQKKVKIATQTKETELKVEAERQLFLMNDNFGDELSVNVAGIPASETRYSLDMIDYIYELEI
ncbi:hypothetical protein BT96DRAFT_950867 [Gymnopus androsaceus JB14]|uniref:Uncharacterized protein n=1 Tax=Gymnopus androsaceus JB14 TaxID=1447944 RepID=A0A6A4GEP3_9AGAR|nr:hypothetical protein BT96DRAFT_950867 [Gymnopus androsaceus JB14]